MAVKKQKVAMEAKMNSLIEDKEKKFVFVGGKGGVGKTTSSSAIAMQLSYDRKVLLLSTDPAHSLSDAFLCTFSGEPKKVPGLPNLYVMEVKPEATLQSEVEDWAKLVKESGMDEMLENTQQFQEWLQGVPGIDEATALATVIGHIESGAFDTIVFDTAPTGHTLKLLQLPGVLQVGLDKLQGWQSKLYGYWSAFKGAATGNNAVNVQKKITERLMKYKAGIEKIGVMLTDNKRTTFVVVCIAELLSINETCRLLSELEKFKVGVSHVIVNQLVEGAVGDAELGRFEELMCNVEGLPDQTLVSQIRSSVQLCNARRNIQRRYLTKLIEADQVTSAGLTVLEMPLLPSEVTGPEALLGFSQRLVTTGYRASGPPGELQNWKPSPVQIVLPSRDEEVVELEDPEEMVSYEVGDIVTAHGLVKAAKYNGLEAEVTGTQPDGRIAVKVRFEGKFKRLALQASNLKLKARHDKSKTQPKQKQADPVSGIKDKLLADPEVQAALKQPKFKAAWDECSANPMAAMKYLADPDIGPFITKMMSKMQ